MRISLLLCLGFFSLSHTMEQQPEPMVCNSVTLGYCVQIVTGYHPERLPLMGNPQRGDIQAVFIAPEPVEERTCRECYRHNKKKIWCCGLCCCGVCTCMTVSSISTIVSGIQKMATWCGGK